MASSLEESEEKFRTLAGSAKDAFVMMDEHDQVSFWNRAATGMFGYNESNIIGKKFHEHGIPPKLHAAYQQEFSRSLTTDAAATSTKTIEISALRKDGTEFAVELSLAAVKVRGKWEVIAVIRDITGRLRAQETLKRSEQGLNLALQVARMGTWDWDLITGTVWRSLIHDQIFGYETLQARWTFEIFLQHIIAEDHAMVLQALRPTNSTNQLKFECRILRANDQAQRWISVQGIIHRDQNKTPVRLQGVVVDCTDLKQAELERQSKEAQSSLSQKLESVGRLASGVAHEINTPMQFITDNTQFLKQALTSLITVLETYRTAKASIASGKNPTEALAIAQAAEEDNELNYLLEEIPRTFEETMGGLKRVTSIIKSLKEFAHPSIAACQPADLNKAIATTIAVSRHEWKYVADVVTEFDPELPMIPLRIDEMNQVMLNLIVNASHAIGDAIKQRGESKGIITLRTKQEGESVLVQVQDNGTGIPASAQSHIFEPFFTTKGIGKGTGQGLAIIRTIVVKNHGGTIHFTTEPGQGTIFHIKLPLQKPPEPNQTPDAPAP